MAVGRPLAGLRVIELAAIGPVPFAGMHLAQMGAEVVVVARPTAPESPVPADLDPFVVGKEVVTLDLKSGAGRRQLLDRVGSADVLIEGHRPGVLERLGLGPESLHGRNPRLVVGRMTGWGQTGPWAQRPGHDVNYIGLTGALNAIGPRAGPPAIPLNLLGDYGGGALYLVVGVLAALRDVERRGHGQVVDAAIVDGVAHLLSGVYAGLGDGYWVDEREANPVDGGAPYYGVYRTRDDRYMAVSAGEKRFYRVFVELVGADVDPDRQFDRSTWETTRSVVAAAFRKRTQDEWNAVFDGSDACVSPVLDLATAARHPHIRGRQTLSVRGGVIRAAPAPRFHGR